MDSRPLAINEPTPELANRHAGWAKARAFETGEAAVKCKRELFLPRVRADDSDAQYLRHLDNTNLYPATTKISQGILGLIFRKRPHLASASARVQLLSSAITAKGLSLDDFAEAIVRETLITNFTGVLVDHPPKGQFPGLNAANADRLGYRPQLSMYEAESILEASYGLIGTGRALTRVRLLEERGTQVRELRINDAGRYEQRIHVSTGGSFQLVSTVLPEIDGKPLTEIPFVIVSSTDKPCPTPSVLQPTVDLNLQHYRLSGVLANMTWMTSGPVVTVIGFNRDKVANDAGIEEEVVPEWDFNPNGVVEIKDANVKVDYFIFDPKGASLVQDQLKALKQDLHTIGHSVLAPEKEAPESPETSLIRRAAENAMLAGFTRVMSRKLAKALNLFARWVDGSEVVFELNTDFMPQGMTAAEHKELRETWLAGGIPHDTFLHCLRDGEVLSPALDPEAEAERAQASMADRPSLGV